jgi:septal ring factor EnvC (AmiA/AmiB activator)
MRSLAIYCLLAAALGADITQKVNPVEKVTKLLERLQKEIEVEGKEEAAAYDKFACFCKEQADNKQYAIEKFTKHEAMLNAKIDDKTARKATLDSEIAEHKTDIEGLEGDQESADTDRATEHEAYASRTAQLSKAISAMERAIEALQASKGDMVDAKAGYTGLVKYKSVIKNSIALAESLGITHSGKALLKLLQQPDTAHSYSYHSNEIVSTLQSLLKNFKQKRTQVDADEQQVRQEHEMSSGARRNQIKALEKSKSEKSAASATLEEQLNAHSTELQQTEDAHAADQNFLNDLTEKCETKAKDWDSRSSTRTQELTAISKAIELLKGDVSKMYGSTGLDLVAKKTKPSLVAKKTKPSKTAPPAEKGHWQWVPDAPAAQVQTEAKKADTEDSDSDSDSDDDDDEDSDEEPVSFLQLERPSAQAARKRVLGFLSSKATALKSAVLTTLLLKMRDAPSPFAKVKQMINDLVERLEAEADAEADQKTWCDTNMKETTASRDEAQQEIESLNALKTEKSSLVDNLSEQIMDYSHQIADLQKALNEATELREKESAQNERTVADATAGKAAVDNAIDVLNSFYNPSFLQKQAPAAEGYERFSAENAGSDGKTVDDMAPDAGGVSGDYGGKTDASKSIISLLEQISEDFDSTISATNTDEDDSQGEYDTFKSDSETDISDKGALKTTAEDDRTQANLDITQAEADLKSQGELLQAAMDELEKLKPVCVDSGMSWEERSARRNQEIESLKEALNILEDMSFLQKRA